MPSILFESLGRPGYWKCGLLKWIEIQYFDFKNGHFILLHRRNGDYGLKEKVISYRQKSRNQITSACWSTSCKQIDVSYVQPKEIGKKMRNHTSIKKCGNHESYKMRYILFIYEMIQHENGSSYAYDEQELTLAYSLLKVKYQPQRAGS